RPEVEKLAGGFLVLEAFEQAHAATAEQPAVETVPQGVYVEKGQGQQQAIGGGDLPAGEQIQGVSGEVVVGQDGALGGPRGAGGVDQSGRRVPVQTCGYANVTRGAGFRNESIEIVACDEKTRRRIVENVRHLALAVEHIQGNEYGAEPHARQVQVNRLHAVGELDRDAVALLDTTGSKGIRHTACAGACLAEGEAAALPL